MKQRDLLLTGAMLFGFGLSIQAQEQLFFFGFEDGVASFTDSANAPDSITSLQYYDHVGSNGASLKPEEYTLGPTYDTTMLVLNGIAPLYSRGDAYDIVEDLEEEHLAEFEAMGAEGGLRYFKYTAGGEAGGTAANDYEANLFVRALPIDDYTSYRLSMYVKASAPEGQMNIDLLRGYYNSEKQFSMTGEQNSGEFKLVKTEFETERWERVTMMSYYQNDSVANRYMYQAGYWWSDSWRKTIDGQEYNMIVQPDQYFVRLAFTGPGVTYYIDDMALTKSWIAGAEYYKNIMRVDFGYDTNLQELAAKTAVKAITFPAENIVIKGVDTYLEEEVELFIQSAEYHDDGYLYIWIDAEDDFEFYENVKVSFTNPEDEALQLVYDGSLYPMALDTNWVNAGKIVPDFQNEPAFFNPSVSAISMDMFSPLYVSSEPEDGSFSLPTTTTSFDVTFNKKIFVEIDEYDPSDTTSVIVMMKGNGKEEVWIPTAYNEETFTVTFSRQAGNTEELVGDFEFTIVQARATSRAPQADPKTITMSFGPADVAPQIFGKIDFSGYNKGTNTIEGLEVNTSCMMEVTEFQGAYSKALKFGLYGATNLENNAPVLTYTFNVTEAGEWLVKYGTSGCLKNSWNDGCKMVVTVIDEVGDTLDIYTEEGTATRPEEGGLVDKIDEQVRTVNFPVAGQYQVVFTLPNEKSWGGGHKGGRVLYYVEVSNAYSRAYAFIEKYNNALTAAKELIESASANTIYTGSYLEDFKAIVADNEGFESTSPTAYNATVATINSATAAMNTRIANVDSYYAAYNAALAMDTLYKDSVGYNQTAAFLAVQKAIADYATLDVTVKTNDEINAITVEVNATTKAMTDRCAIIDEFDANIADAIVAFDNHIKFAELAEYKALQDAYNANKDFAKFASTDDELKAVNEVLKAAISTLNNKVAAANTLTAQAKNLAEKAASLVTDWGGVNSEDLAAQLAVELEDNQALVGVYQLAIKAALEDLMSGDGIDEAGIDMSGYIQNSQLYTAIKGYSTPDYMGQPHNGGNAVKFNEQMATQPEKIIPGWTVEAVNGNVYMFHSTTAEISDSRIAIDWNSNVTFSQELNNLPAGKYSFSVAPQCDAAAQLSGEIVFIQETEQGTVSDTLNLSAEVNPDRLINFNYYGGTLKLYVHIVDANTWSYYNELNGLYLVEKLEDYDYAAAKAASIEALGEAYTGVGSIEAPSKVQYYNLNGMQVAEPNAGINIRISTGADGQRVVEKVLVK